MANFKISAAVLEHNSIALGKISNVPGNDPNHERGAWPKVIENSFSWLLPRPPSSHDALKMISDQIQRLSTGRNGEFEALNFPSFIVGRTSPSIMTCCDRINIVISEGLSQKESPTSTPVARVRNVVVFSFRHAPISECSMQVGKTQELTGLGRLARRCWNRLAQSLPFPNILRC
jgi:hypothetical protein